MRPFLSRTLTTLICAASLLTANAADTSTRVFAPSIRSLQLTNPDNFLLPPVIRLNSTDRITVTFDEIGYDSRYLRYRLLHCNADWQPSQLVEAEYLDSFNEAEIEDYAFSSNTFVHFVNYRIELPNERMRPLVSGNYLLQVYPEGDPDELLLQARFQVSENSVAITGDASGRTDRGFNTEWQQVDFRVSPGTYRIGDPFTELKAVISQNSAPNATRVIERPMRRQGDLLVYEHQQELIFPAGNEYRRFETVRTNYAGMHVDSMRYGDTHYHAYLTPDLPRRDTPYAFDRTQHGRYKVDEYNATDADLGADYVTVHFSLRMPPMHDADLYVDGEFTGGSTDPAFRMTYNHDTGAYELQLPLKQGSYNYRYTALPRNGRTPDPAPIEGNHYETLNTYDISLFHRTPGERADRLIGTATITAQP